MIQQGLAQSFLVELLQGFHHETDQYRIALYVAEANIGPNTRAYTPQGEVNGLGYHAGGMLLTGYRIGLDELGAWATFNDPTWPLTSIRVHGALVYNYSAQNRAVGVLDLGQDFISTNGPFTMKLPDTPMIRISSVVGE